MTTRTGTRIAALAALGAAAVTGLVGCGNGLEVGGPSASSSSVVASPTAVPSSATGSSTPSSADSGTPAASPSPDRTPGSGRTSSGAATSGEPGGDASSEPPSGGNNGGSKGGDNGGSNGVSACTLGDLEIGVKVPSGGGAAGSQYVLIRFTNTSGTACTMYGYAGVSFVGHKNGTQLGKAGQRDRSRTPERVRLAPGSTKSELVQIANAGNFDPADCVPTTSDGFRIYPPDSYTSAYVPFETSACQSKKVTQLTVYPVGTKA